MEPIVAWHFVQQNGRHRYDKELVEVGKTYKTDKQPILCEQGYHASLRAIDALRHAPGPIICRVQMGGHIEYGYDKLVAQERTVIWMADATDVLFEFSCRVAEEALKARQAEGYKFEQATFDVIQAGRDFRAGKITKAQIDKYVSNAWSAAWSAAELDAESAARSAVLSAADLAAESAARSAARSAAESDARSAVLSDAESDAELAAMSAAWLDAWSAAWSAQNDELTKRLCELGQRSV